MADPFRGALTVVLGPKSTIAIMKSGKVVKHLEQGIYKLVTSDGSPKQDVSVAQTAGGSFKQLLTSATFKGTKSVRPDRRPVEGLLGFGQRRLRVLHRVEVRRLGFIA